MSIGERLRSLRKNMKMTLREESEILGVSLNTVYRWEHNLTVPRKSALKKVVDYYTVPIEWVLHGDAEEQSGKCSVCVMGPEGDIEHKLLRMFRRLTDINKYKILGYVERTLIETQSLD